MNKRGARQDDATSARKFLAPEAIQTSSMDCGPATLKSLLSGFGIKASYGRLREACHTSVDGTSIDTLEELTNALGLDADQEMMPIEHVLSREEDCLPALVVTRLSSGLTHFVVVWRTLGPFVQIMDPGRGRRWMKRTALEKDLYIHESEVEVSEVAEWLTSPAFVDPLRAALVRLLGRNATNGVLEVALRGGWKKLAALDAALRATARLVEHEATTARQAPHVFGLLLDSTEGADAHALIPADLWTVRPVASAQKYEDDRHDKLVVRGAVVLKVNGVGDVSPDLSVELSAAVHATEVGPGRHLLQLLRQDGLWRILPLLAGLAVAGLGSVIEALLFRGAFDVSQHLAVFEQRMLGALALLVLLAALSLIEWPVARGLWNTGRRLELRLRRAFLHKLPRLGDRYFQSRPISNMAECSHLLHWIRLLPGHGGQIVRCLCELSATVVGVVWLHPRSAPLVLPLAALMVALPLLGQPVLLEKDLRMRGHSGGLARFYLDALLGLSAIRAHTAEGALAAEHGSRLREWARAARDVARTQVVIETLIGLVGFGLAALVVFHYLVTAEGSGWAILLVYWVLMVPALGIELSFLIQQYPQHRNVTLRLLEPLGAEETASDEDALGADEAEAGPASAVAPAITFEAVSVQQAGNQVLAVDALSIPAGSHVAIVGVSGAGKSSLVGLLLGWYRPNTGTVYVDGAPLAGRVLARLRQRTTWVDPMVQLWNRSLLDNLRYGREGERRPVGEAVEAAELDEVLARLPMGLQTSVGDGGALLSGGEGQRVRLGRGVCRGTPSLVILDEAFCGLERTRRCAMLVAARERWKNATLLCITHDIGQTRGFDRVLVIEGGRVVEDGAPSALAEQPESRYAELLAAETRALARLAGPEWRRLSVDSGHVAGGGGHHER
ncbi:MAG TPA: ATP-binding cassette domain-containing protein [Polyangia bacterium]